MITKVKVWRCWQGCVKDNPGMCEHGLFPSASLIEGVDSKRPYLAFWVGHSASGWTLPKSHLFVVYSLIDGKQVGTLARDNSRFVSFRGSTRHPEKYGPFEKCVTLKDSWVSIVTGPGSILSSEEREVMVAKAFLSYKHHEFSEVSGSDLERGVEENGSSD